MLITSCDPGKEKRLSKIGPKEAAARALRQKQIEDAPKPAPEPEAATTEPDAQAGYNAFMRAYMRRWRAGEVGNKHRKADT